MFGLLTIDVVRRCDRFIILQQKIRKLRGKTSDVKFLSVTDFSILE